jgi:hypothetical protein
VQDIETLGKQGWSFVHENVFKSKYCCKLVQKGGGCFYENLVFDTSQNPMLICLLFVPFERTDTVGSSCMSAKTAPSRCGSHPALTYSLSSLPTPCNWGNLGSQSSRHFIPKGLVSDVVLRQEQISEWSNSS